MGDVLTSATPAAAASRPSDPGHRISDVPNASVALMELVERRSKIIDLMASGAPLSETLDQIARAVEAVAPPALCSILLLRADGKHLRPAAAPSLPAAYCAAVDGLEIGPNVGSCGTAAFTKEPVIVTDIATDPKWAPAKDFAMSFGLRACWSMPIVRHDGVVLGTIAMYYNEPRAPTERDWGLLEPFAQLVRLALAQARREEDLRMSEERLRLATETSGIGTYDIDLQAQTAYWSPKFKAILGLPESEQPSLRALLSSLHPDDRERFKSRVQHHSDPDGSHHDREEYRVLRPSDGKHRIVCFHGRVFHNREGMAIQTIGTLADVTDQRNHESELAAARDEAERANHAKSDFLASMSHELRTPLNAIIGFSDVIRQCMMGPISPPKYREYAEDIYVSGNHLLNLINDVLDMAKIEAGKRELNLEEIHVSQISTDALRLVEPQAKTNQIQLEMQVEHDLVLMADKRGLTQVLVNLLSNAVKFTKPGGRVTVFGHRTPGGASLGVEDTGIGMTPEGLQKALEPFGQVEELFTVEGRGTGLGLSLIKALLKAHGAEFKIETVSGKGTRAWGEFPGSSVIAARAVA